MSEWFIDWFSSEEYLSVYQHRNTDDAKNLINLILKNISIPNKAKILDAACGAGRHSILLAQKGFQVTAFDLSEPLLENARKLSSGLNLNIDYLNADLRTVMFDKCFYLILNLFTSFGYFENDDENFRFLKDSKNWLEKRGYFVLDYLNKNFILENLVPQSIRALDNKTIIENRTYINDRINKEIIIQGNGNTERHLESVKLYSLDEIENVASKSGLIIEHIFGNYRGIKFHPSESERLIVIFRK